MRIDWIAVIRSWARRDLQDGKLVYRKTGGVKPENPHIKRIEAEQHIPANPERAKKLAEDLKNKYGNIDD